MVSNPAGRFAHVCGDDPTRIGVRVPSLLDEVAALADAAGGLLITSANQRGGPDPAELAEVPASFRERAAFAVDGGRLPGAPSAVLDISGEEPRLLRAGPGGEEAMAAVQRAPAALADRAADGAGAPAAGHGSTRRRPPPRCATGR